MGKLFKKSRINKKQKKRTRCKILHGGKSRKRLYGGKSRKRHIKKRFSKSRKNKKLIGGSRQSSRRERVPDDIPTQKKEMKIYYIDKDNV